MECIRPSECGFTIYSKSGCLQCSRAKTLLHDNNLDFIIVDCDDYIIEDKPSFLLFMNSITCRDVKAFPIIFNNGAYIGGYSETKAHVDKLTSFDDNLSF